MTVPQTEIIVTKDGVEIARKIVTPGEYVFGRGGDVDFLMDTPLASRHHARLTVNYDEWLVEDLGSANGTFINGQSVAPNEMTRVFPTQSLRVGDATVTLRRLRGSEAPDASLAPAVAAVRTLLPEDLRERRYAIGKIVAQGGMGAILAAQDQAIRRGVAMKVMLQSGDAGDVARFIEEAQITGQLEHPNIVPVHELGVDEQEQVFYTMKFVNGITLKKVLELLAEGREGTIKKYSHAVLLTVFQKVCDAVAFAHAKGVIHRDLKPENVMIGDFGEVLVMDWGLAKNLGKRSAAAAASSRESVGGDGAPPSPAANAGASSATMAGSILGTPQYMAPEQARGEVETMDQRADIYALGGILYHLLALRPSVAAGDPMMIVGKVAQGVIEPLTPHPLAAKNPTLNIPDSLAAVVRKAMALEPAARYQSVPELQTDIEAYQNGFATSAEKAGLGKQLVLAIKRNKVASAAAAIILMLTAGFMVKVIASEKRAQQSLARLKETAPTFQAQALALIETAPIAEGAPEKALEHIGYAITLAPESADYLVTRGRILQTLLRLDEARSSFAKAQVLAPEHPAAKANTTLCDAILRERLGDGTFSPNTLGKLASAMSTQGRNAEALHVTRSLGKIGAGQLAIWNAIIKKAGLSQSLRVDPDGSLSLHLNGEKSLDQVSFLRGIPLNELFISGTQVSDLSPLAGMPLRNFDIGESRVTDITPLARMPLQRIVLSGAVTDISALRGAPLEVLLINPARGRGPSDFSVLRDMPLRELIVPGGEFSDLRLIEGKAMTIVTIDSSKVTDLSPLRGMPLERLDMGRIDRAKPRDFAFLTGNKTLRTLTAGSNSQLVDLSALRGVPLEALFLQDTSVADLRPLAGSKVSEINLSGTPFTAIDQLAAMHQLATVNLDKTPVSDLSPLSGTTVQKLTLSDCVRIRTVAPLAKLSTLRVLLLPVQVRDAEALRNHPALQWIGYGGSVPYLGGDAAKRTTELREFWKMCGLEKELRAAEPDGRLRPSKFPYMQTRFPRARQLGKKWYSHVPGKFTWPEAKQVATDFGGHLATITNQAEYDLARQLSSLGQNQVCWLGGQADKPGGTWSWVTGEPWKFTHWAKWKDGRTEPNGTDGKGNPETVLAFGYFGAIFVSSPDLCDVIPDHPDATGFLVEWED